MKGFHFSGSQDHPFKDHGGCSNGTTLTFSIVAGLIALALLHVLGRFDFYLSHTFSELFAISVAWALFLIVWNTRRQVDNDAFVFLGTALFFIGVIDLVHALGYQGNRFISLQGVSDASVQLWLAGRGLQSLAFLAFPLLLNRRFNQRWSLVGFSILTVLILLSIFHWKIFPTCYVPDTGATPFKWTFEGVIIVLYASALWLLHDQRQYLDGEVYVLFAGAIGFMVPAQFASAFYNPRYEWLNLLGHDFKLASFFMVYLALIRSGLQRPYAVLFHKLDATARALMDANIERTTILDHQPDHILLHDLDQRILWANQAVCTYVGKPREAIMGARCQEIWRQPGSTCHRRWNHREYRYPNTRWNRLAGAYLPRARRQWRGHPYSRNSGEHYRAPEASGCPATVRGEVFQGVSLEQHPDDHQFSGRWHL